MAIDKDLYEADLLSYPHLPVAVARNAGVWPNPKHLISIAACARWETPYALEWLLYHRSIGVNHVYLYCNDDTPDDLYKELLPLAEGDNPFVTFLYYGFQGLQYEMYFHFLRNFAHETEWYIFLDVDEFVCIRNNNKIVSLISSTPANADAIYLNWTSFGNNGHKIRPKGSVLLNYTRREIYATPFTKVLIRSRRVPYAKFFQHKRFPIMHDYTKLDESIIAYNVLGDRLDTYYDGFPETAWKFLFEQDRSQRILNTAFVAHFNIKSEEDFDLRVKRGTIGDYKMEETWGAKTTSERREYMEITNKIEDTYLRDYWIEYLSRGRSLAVFPISRWPIVSRNKHATQSSTAHERSIEDDAMAIVSGYLTGGSQNHTLLEDNPWWQIDLGSTYLVHEVRLFNRMDGVLERMSRFEILAQNGEGSWQAIYTREIDDLYGGVDGTPFIWVSETGFLARYVRLVVTGQTYLHLDQIEFYGVPLELSGQQEFAEPLSVRPTADAQERDIVS